MMDTKLKCPKCGGILFRRCYCARGQWVQLVESQDGAVKVIDTDLDGLRYRKEPKFMRCAEGCKGRILNPDYP